MSLWVELHCDEMAPGLSNLLDPDCAKIGGNNPGVLVSNGKASFAVRYLKAEAVKKGWRIGRRVVCPGCARKMGAK